MVKVKYYLSLWTFSSYLREYNVSMWYESSNSGDPNLLFTLEYSSTTALSPHPQPTPWN